MNSGSNGSPRSSAPPFSEAELEAATKPQDQGELDEVEPAEIDESPEQSELPVEKLAQRSGSLDAEKIKRIIESLLFVADKPVTLDQLHQATGIHRNSLTQALAALSQGQAAAVDPRRPRDARDHRLSAARDPGRSRGHPRR